MVEFFRITWDEGVFEVSYDTQTDEIVVPNDVIGDHEETEELFGEQELTFLIADVGEGRRIGIGVTFEELIPI